MNRPVSAVLVAGILMLGCALGACSTSESAETSDEPPPSESPRAEKSSDAEEETATQPSSSQAPSNLEELAATLPNGAHPFDEIVTSAQPTREQLQLLDGAGIRTVVNFRPHDEEGAWDEGQLLEETGINYVHIPIAGGDDLSRQNVDLFDDVLRKEQGPFLVHCSSSNRVGAMFALRAHWIRDKSPEAALEIGRSAGLTRLEDAVRAKIGQEGD